VIFLFSATQENNMSNVATMPPRVNGIRKTSLYVESPARSAEFYRRVFGFEPLEPGEPLNDETRLCPMRAGDRIRRVGDSDRAFATTNVFEADYYVPLLAHASMEPMVALAEFKDGRVTAWAPTQNPQAVQAIVSSELGIPPEDVICNVTLLGGGFGRKSKPDYVAEAAVLSKKLGRPVKVVWTREDDIKFDYYNAVAAMYMKAAVDDKGKPTAWLQGSVFPPITSTFDVNAVYGDPPHLAQGWTDLPYDLPTYASRMVLRTLMSGLAGCDLWRTSITPLQFSVSPMNSPIARIATPWSICWILSDRRAPWISPTCNIRTKVRITRRIPGKQAACGRLSKWSPTSPAGPRRRVQKATDLESLRIAVS
jgi:hypothetical protein